jgi:hypothetical protein
MFILGKATSRWTRSRGDQSQLVPAFNGFQVRAGGWLSVAEGVALPALTCFFVRCCLTPLVALQMGSAAPTYS